MFSLYTRRENDQHFSNDKYELNPTRERVAFTFDFVTFTSYEKLLGKPLEKLAETQSHGTLETEKVYSPFSSSKSKNAVVWVRKSF